MKITNKTFLAPLVKMEVKELTSLVNETLDVQLKVKPGITLAQLSQIHKQKRMIVRRQRFTF